MLIRAGCCDSIAGELTRPALIWQLYARKTGRNRYSLAVNRQSQGTLGKGLPAHPLPIPVEYSESRRVQHEIETLGFPLSRHPLELSSHLFRSLDYVHARDIGLHIGRKVTMVGWLITEKIDETKDGDARSLEHGSLAGVVLSAPEGEASLQCRRK